MENIGNSFSCAEAPTSYQANVLSDNDITEMLNLFADGDFCSECTPNANNSTRRNSSPKGSDTQTEIIRHMGGYNLSIDDQKFEPVKNLLSIYNGGKLMKQPQVNVIFKNFVQSNPQINITSIRCYTRNLRVLYNFLSDHFSEFSIFLRTCNQAVSETNPNSGNCIDNAATPLPQSPTNDDDSFRIDPFLFDCEDFYYFDN